MKRRPLAALAGVIFALVGARPLPAQTDKDTSELARAVATVLADSMLSSWAKKEPLVWRYSHLPLDSAVARILGGHPRFQAPVTDSAHAVWVGIGNVEMGADTARVTVRREQDYGGSGPLTFWMDSTPYVFERVRDGWRFIRREFTRHADGGPVRGR